MVCAEANQPVSKSAIRFHIDRTMKRKRVKSGTSEDAARAKRLAFAHEYIANGRNGSQAAIAAGCAPKSAGVRASEMLSREDVRAIIAAETAKAAAKSGLSVERTLLEVARLAYADPRRLYDEQGNQIPVHLLDDDTAAMVASIECDGEQRQKTKLWDKGAALEKAMKYHGLYEADNKQKPPVLPPVLNIVAVSTRR